MKIIDISTPSNPDTYTMVDDEDFEALAAHKWHAMRQSRGPGVYAMRTERINGRKVHYSMHREILRPPHGMMVDHIDRDKLNNQRSNLRIVNSLENTRNQGLQRNNTSGFIGVSKKDGGWRAAIRVNGKSIHLGVFVSPEAAARSRDAASTKYFGEFAVLNFQPILAVRDPA